LTQQLRPHAFVIAAPSGTGKTSIIKQLLQNRQDLEFSVSCTTRPPREREAEGGHYYYISDEQFDAHLARGDFLEWEPVHDHRYGTLRSEVDRIIDRGRYPVFDLDVKGALTLRRKLVLPHLIFIYVSDPELYRHRLEQRNSETLQQIELRLSRLESELAFAQEFHHRISNDGPLKETVTALSALIDEILAEPPSQ